MSQAFSNYMDGKVLDHIFGGNTAGNVYTPPATLYFGLSTATINADGTGVTEPPTSGGATAYARVAVANTTTNFSASSLVGGVMQKQNATAINFPQASGNWGTCTYFFVSDSATIGGGNIIAFGALGTQKTINNGDTASFAANTLTIQLQ